MTRDKSAHPGPLVWLLYTVPSQVCPIILNISCIMHVCDKDPLFRYDIIAWYTRTRSTCVIFLTLVTASSINRWLSVRPHRRNSKLANFLPLILQDVANFIFFCYGKVHKHPKIKLKTRRNIAANISKAKYINSLQQTFLFLQRPFTWCCLPPPQALRFQSQAGELEARETGDEYARDYGKNGETSGNEAVIL